MPFYKRDETHADLGAVMALEPVSSEKPGKETTVTEWQGSVYAGLVPMGQGHSACLIAPNSNQTGYHSRGSMPEQQIGVGGIRSLPSTTPDLLS